MSWLIDPRTPFISSTRIELFVSSLDGQSMWIKVELGWTPDVSDIHLQLLGHRTSSAAPIVGLGNILINIIPMDKAASINCLHEYLSRLYIVM